MMRKLLSIAAILIALTSRADFTGFPIDSNPSTPTWTYAEATVGVVSQLFYAVQERAWALTNRMSSPLIVETWTVPAGFTNVVSTNQVTIGYTNGPIILDYTTNIVVNGTNQTLYYYIQTTTPIYSNKVYNNRVAVYTNLVTTNAIGKVSYLNNTGGVSVANIPVTQLFMDYLDNYIITMTPYFTDLKFYSGSYNGWFAKYYTVPTTRKLRAPPLTDVGYYFVLAGNSSYVSTYQKVSPNGGYSGEGWYPCTLTYYPSDFPYYCPAAVMEQAGIGHVKNLVTNVWGQTTGGDYYWTRQPATKNQVWTLWQAVPCVNTFTMSGFSITGLNGNYYPISKYSDLPSSAFDTDGLGSSCLNFSYPVYMNEASNGVVHGNGYNWIAAAYDGSTWKDGVCQTMNGVLYPNTNWWDLVSEPTNHVVGFSTNNVTPVWIKRAIADFDSRFYTDPRRATWRYVVSAGVTPTPVTVTARGHAFVDLENDQNYLGVQAVREVTETVTLNGGDLDSSYRWYRVTSATVSGAGCTGAVVSLLWTNITLYGDTPNFLAASNIDERVYYLKKLLYTTNPDMQWVNSDGIIQTGIEWWTNGVAASGSISTDHNHNYDLDGGDWDAEQPPDSANVPLFTNWRDQPGPWQTSAFTVSKGISGATGPLSSYPPWNQLSYGCVNWILSEATFNDHWYLTAPTNMPTSFIDTVEAASFVIVGGAPYQPKNVVGATTETTLQWWKGLITSADLQITNCDVRIGHSEEFYTVEDWVFSRPSMSLYNATLASLAYTPINVVEGYKYPITKAADNAENNNLTSTSPSISAPTAPSLVDPSYTFGANYTGKNSGFSSATIKGWWAETNLHYGVVESNYFTRSYPNGPIANHEIAVRVYWDQPVPPPVYQGTFTNPAWAPESLYLATTNTIYYGGWGSYSNNHEWETLPAGPLDYGDPANIPNVADQTVGNCYIPPVYTNVNNLTINGSTVVTTNRYYWEAIVSFDTLTTNYVQSTPWPEFVSSYTNTSYTTNLVGVLTNVSAMIVTWSATGGPFLAHAANYYESRQNQFFYQGYADYDLNVSFSPANVGSYLPNYYQGGYNRKVANIGVLMKWDGANGFRFK